MQPMWWPGCADIWPTTSILRKRLPHLMVGATDALEYGGHDSEAPLTVATAIDALLGIKL